MKATQLKTITLTSEEVQRAIKEYINTNLKTHIDDNIIFKWTESNEVILTIVEDIEVKEQKIFRTKE